MLNVYSAAYKDKDFLGVLRAEHEEHLVKRERNIISNAYRHDYMMTNEEMDHLQSCFPRQLIISEDPRLNCSHPVLAVLNSYANDDVRQQIARCQSRGITTMTIGDAAHAPFGANHNCLLVDDLRERFRVANNRGATHDLIDHAQYGDYTPHCVRGCQNCTFNAEEAFAVHSLYDVSMRDIATTFAKHGLRKLTAYMHISTMLYDEPYVDPYPYFSVSRVGSKLLFNMRDDSLPYAHDFGRWRDWAYTTVIRCGTFNIVFEHVRRHGPMHVIVATRVHADAYITLDSSRDISHGIYRTVPLGDIFQNAYKVPDITHSVENKFLVPQKGTPHFIVPAHVVLGLMAYANRTADEGYKFAELATYSSGLRRSIVIGGKTYQHSWDCDAEQYYRVVFSLFVLGAIARTERTAGISAVFRYLRDTKHQAPTGISYIIDRIERYFHTVEKNPVGQMGFYLWDFKPILIADITIHQVVDAIVHDGPRRHLLPDEDDTPDDSSCDETPSSDESTSEEDQSSADCDSTAGSSDSSITVIANEPAALVPSSEEEIDPPRGTRDAPLFRYEYEIRRLRPSAGQTPVPATSVSANITAVPTSTTASTYVSLTAVTPPVVVCAFADAPDKFVLGHCAMAALWSCLPREGRPNVKTFIQQCAKLLDDARVAKTLDVTETEIRDYIYKGVYDNNCSSAIIPMAAVHYAVHIAIIRANHAPLVCGDTSKVPRYIEHANNHFTVVDLQGGSVHKFPALLRDIVLADRRVLDCSAAPGYLAKLIEDQGANLTCGVYKGKMASSLTQKLFSRVIEYDNISQLSQHIDGKFDVIVNDAARAENSEDLILEVTRAVLPHLNTGGSYLCKSFGNAHALWRELTRFANVEKRAGAAGTTECYYYCTGYYQSATDGDRWRSLYDRFNEPVTTHYFVESRVAVRVFAREYFSGEFKKHMPVVADGADGVTFRALTGFASAAKTTMACTMFTRPVFIAPSRDLTKTHHAKGVASFTPHVVFSQKLDMYDTIIIDEISQFPIDYIALVCYTFPGKEVVVLGDVEQTPYVNYQSTRSYKVVYDIGVRNNIVDVYKIPQDVTVALNRKHRFNITSRSDVRDGFRLFAGDVLEFAGSNIPVISFNNATAAALKAKNVNSHTITTFTGSRDHTVVFYIDSAAVASELANKPQYIYTAVSRATHQIVLAGDYGYIAKYYFVHGCRLSRFEEINQVYQESRIQLPDDGVMKINISNETTSTPVTLETAVTTLQSKLLAVVDPDSETLSTKPAEVAAVESGQLKAPIDALLPIPQTTKVYKLTSARLCLHQIASSKLEATQTLVKRYAKLSGPNDPKRMHLAYTELMGGLCRALYGRTDALRKLRDDMRVAPEYLKERAGQYLEALQVKINSNPSTAKELEVEFEEAKEALKFFNKRQTKFKPDAGFDDTTKCGQGVAATSKSINLLFGVYARSILDRMREILLKNARPIILATHNSEAHLNDVYSQHMSELGNHDNTNWTCNDFSEWDSSFRSCFAKVTSRLLIMIGCPEKLAQWFENFRESWRMEYRHEFGKTVLSGFEKQFSGNPFTICENTIGNMALCFISFEYKGLDFAMFKGDDSAVRCTHSTLTEKGRNLIKFTGHGLKLHNTPIGEFAGWFLTPYGLYPDVVRYAAKFIDKPYRSEEHLQEALNSLQERVAAVKTETQKRCGATMAYLHYRGILGVDTFTVGEIENLFNFIKSSRTIKFSDLKPQELPVRLL